MNGRAFTRSGPSTVQMTRDEVERRLLGRLRAPIEGLGLVARVGRRKAIRWIRAR